MKQSMTKCVVFVG